jgi:hypothetical protein
VSASGIDAKLDHRVIAQFVVHRFLNFRQQIFAQTFRTERRIRHDAQRLAGPIEPRAGSEPNVEPLFAELQFEPSADARHDLLIAATHFLCFLTSARSRSASKRSPEEARPLSRMTRKAKIRLVTRMERDFSHLI